ncbi:3,4-dihydroxy-2-butanone 4-phosphate synthase [Plectosphaerella plurivora]|uniref:3,4-dihydroxy-2-butanone 4-phosphate synthase n=1 Tax=Plectosphaerella plurivora TaxID=936078 RepID=A0A9P8V454_9PEZI|nr:3,4-dihydroxy-2-butanone 4-phosphate synthase [Plectosphaerella plurivora]
MPSTTIDLSAFDSIPDCINAFRNGEFLVVLDDPGRENEADLIIAASSITAAQMAFMVRHSSGYICAPLAPTLTEKLELPQMVDRTSSQDPRGTAYTVSVDAADPAVTTGISAHDRALTCRVLADPSSVAADLRRPGHVLPLRAREGGVRVRPGHTEAAVDFARLAGKGDAAVICEIVDDGEPIEGVAEHTNPGMLRGDACIAFARRWNLKVCTIEALVAYLEKTEGKIDANGSS